jgi:hypothetical protein
VRDHPLFRKLWHEAYGQKGDLIDRLDKRSSIKWVDPEIPGMAKGTIRLEICRDNGFYQKSISRDL